MAATSPTRTSRLDMVVVSHGMRDLLARCVASIANLDEPWFPGVIVVNNGPDPWCAEVVRESLPNARVLEPGANMGFARAANLGWRHARARYVLHLNPDTELPPKGMARLVDAFDEDPRLEALGARHVYPDGREQPSTAQFPSIPRALLRRVLPRGLHPAFLRAARAHDVSGDVDWVHGSFLLVRRNLRERIGGFCEQFPIGGEDMDLCYRVRAAGGRVFFDAGYSIVHAARQSWKDEAGANVRAAVLRFYELHRPGLRAKLAKMLVGGASN